MGNVRSTVVGPPALMLTGLAVFYGGSVFQTTSDPSFDGMEVDKCVLFYLPSIDTDSSEITGIVKTRFSPARLPSRARAVLDYIANLDIFEEFYLVEALQRCQDFFSDNLPKLRALADKRGLRDELEYWIQEAKDDCEV